MQQQNETEAEIQNETEDDNRNEMEAESKIEAENENKSEAENEIEIEAEKNESEAEKNEIEGENKNENEDGNKDEIEAENENETVAENVNETEDEKEIEAENENEAERENELEDEDENDSEAENENEIDTIIFTHEDIGDQISQLSDWSGPGPDGVPAILLKKARTTVSIMLNNIFQHSFQNSEIPDILKIGFICPILKPNSSREKPAAWRPVSLTSHIIKTFERVIRRKIVAFLEANNLMDTNQHGSRKGRSCLSQLLEHHDEILRMLEDGSNVDVIYTDFEKAYEKLIIAN